MGAAGLVEFSRKATGAMTFECAAMCQRIWVLCPHIIYLLGLAIRNAPFDSAIVPLKADTQAIVGLPCAANSP